MAKLYNLARVVTATTGPGTITLGSAVSGFLSFADAGVQDQDEVSYAIKDGTASEVGTGTYSSAGPTLTRTVSKSTNSDQEINLSGSAEVFITPLAEDYYTLEQVTSEIQDLESAVASAVPSSRTIGTDGLASGGGDLSENRTIDVPKADGTEFRAGTDDTKALTTKAAYDSVAEVELTDASTIAVDMTAGTDFVVTLGGNRTLGNPTVTGVIGKKGRIRIVHSNRTLAFGSNWEFAEGTAPDLSSGTNRQDILYYDVIASDRVLGALVPDIS